MTGSLRPGRSSGNERDRLRVFLLGLPDDDRRLYGRLLGGVDADQQPAPLPARPAQSLGDRDLPGPRDLPDKPGPDRPRPAFARRHSAALPHRGGWFSLADRPSPDDRRT